MNSETTPSRNDAGWLVWKAGDSTAEEGKKEVTHRKRLALILRYIASMHHSADGVDLSFVRDCDTNEIQRLISTDFFQGTNEQTDDTKVLFSTSQFRCLLDVEGAAVLFPSPPFSFYKASSSPSSQSYQSRIQRSITFSSKHPSENDGRSCWLRLIRLSIDSPPIPNKHFLRDYIEHWKAKAGVDTLRQLLTVANIAMAPKLAPDAPHRSEIKSFLRSYKKYLLKSAVRAALEPMYNCLFEWVQTLGEGGCDEELVWGFGNARMVSTKDGNTTVINGPLLEVMVEVELAQDGALLVRPRDHTGVALNREVVMALAGAVEGSSPEVISNLHRTVSEMETSQLSPGQPATYVKLLKHISVQLSSGGSFQSAAQYSPSQQDNKKLVVTDSWCLYQRRKPQAVWARDASALEEQLLRHTEATDSLPKASWVLTYGPGILDELHDKKSAKNSSAKKERSSGSLVGSIKSRLFGRVDELAENETSRRQLFPLPASDAQNRIANLLLCQNYPAVICEGPPGTGKTHTIANILCAYLCQGKRVLITSKGAPALSVLRKRLPKNVQELCVDVSTSETTGMRQLQQTVERMADRLSRISMDMELEKCALLQKNIDNLHGELESIDKTLEMHNERKSRIFTRSEGQQLAEIALSLIEATPWLLKTLALWTVDDVRSFHSRAELLLLEENDPINLVSNFARPPSDALTSHVAARAGETLSYLKETASKTVASLPLIGTLSGIHQAQAQLLEQVECLKVADHPPRAKEDWQLALRALKHGRAISAFHRETLLPVVEREQWPTNEIYEENHNGKRLKKSFVVRISEVLAMKELASKLNVSEELELSIESTLLDRRRSNIAIQVQQLAEELVEAKVVTELSRMFSADAQSALIRFAQIAGKARFSRASQPSKMTQRQRRHRKEYLKAFEKCVRYIPCWVLTSSQISDYLPPEFGLFDLVVIDEASQSDVNVLPGMLRGKQWLIVGDGKQVSPSESFVSEAKIDSLRAALPESPLGDSLLPGNSFFDLCAEAFPRGRAVLREHFRCAPEMIQFSNAQFYDQRLVPLRLPTSSERITPSLMDVRVKGGVKSGKVNEKECDTIVGMVKDFVNKAESISPRSIGIISLVGSEQSRLIRGRLLDAIGPQKYKEHEILVGDPPTFQGAERDIVFLSLVCSPGSVPTQNQLMHAQRANVALSRARDKMVLVRSIDLVHIPNCEDIKVPIIEFFETAASRERVGQQDGQSGQHQSILFSCRFQLEKILEVRLQDRGFSVRRMGIVWNDAISVENEDSGLRAALYLDCAGESKQEWTSVVAQQRSIERVGWKCLRVDALGMLVNFERAFQRIEEFLLTAGVRASFPCNAVGNRLNEAVHALDIIEVEEEEDLNDNQSQTTPVVVISSDGDTDDGGDENLSGKKSFDVYPDPAQSNLEVEGDTLKPEQFGDVVDLTFLRSTNTESRTTASVYGDQRLTDSLDGLDSGCILLNRERSLKKKRSSGRDGRDDRDDAYLGDQSEVDSVALSASAKRRRKQRRLDKYSRDGRWFPGRSSEEIDDANWYDTDSDLAETSFHT